MLFTSNFLALGLAYLPAVLGVPEFVSHGRLTDWTGPQYGPEHNGKRLNVSNVYYTAPDPKGAGDPPLAFKFEQTFDKAWTDNDPQHNHRYHSELSYPHGYKRGETKFYGFAFRLPSDWEFTSQSYNIMQFIANFGDTGCDDYSPTTMMWLNNTKLYTRIKTGQLLPGKACANPKESCTGANAGKNCQPIRPFELPNLTIEGGKWYKVTLQVTWQSDNTGQFKVWVNGDKKWDQRDIATTLLDDRREFEFRVGLYANSWHDEGRLVGSQGFRSVWVDEVGIGSAFEDADPDRL